MLFILSSREYCEVKPIADFARLISAHKKAGSPARRSTSLTLVSAFLVASSTSLMISRTDAPRPVPIFIVSGNFVVAFAAAKCARAISRTST